MMKKDKFAALALAVLLAGCSPAQPPAAQGISASSEPSAASAIQLPVETAPEQQREVYQPEEGLTAQETIAAYFDQQYQAYTSLSDIDISGLLDLNQMENRNLLTWLQILNQRRRLLRENDLCYVETEVFPYTILYEEQPEDDRMSFWSSRMETDYDEVYHFRISGEEGRAYPPTFAVNAQHTVFLKREGGIWKIIRHYYPGSVRSLRFAGELTLPSEEEMLAELKLEFSSAQAAQAVATPPGAAPYNAEAAVDYANRYMAKSNSEFYHIGDWQGNCQNFVSQALSHGFGDEMTGEWFGGSGGGSAAWESVNSFWRFAVENGGMGGQVVPSIASAQAGDVMQTRTKGAGDEDEYNHILIVTDGERLLLAQNSPACLVYYSDLVNVQTRIFRPCYLFA
ncbi:amidase domain-containing protein [Clostridiaceae bacterium NSJ-31]|uniref:Amidase domain-containing protein n=1 Tax=Ligaoa zhengdingensis TaxID=2763658 RepID=A0A926E069_9FIRM|nr:amidase domain-containing protein [Ligaoa zhengdingensis]MBC8546759.1 amidase domain-containing protein [Ligaoa zhengdingensis]